MFTAKNKRKQKRGKQGFSHRLKLFFLKSMKIATVVMATAIVAVAVYQFSGFVSEFLNKPIAQVLVDGEFNAAGEFAYADEAQIIAMAKEHIEQGFIQESLPALRRQLERSPWVDTVSLRRQWPDKLIVTVVEQQPIARWGDHGFVNYRGEIIAVAELEKLSHLSVLSGQKSEAFDMMQRYRTIAHLMKDYEVSVVALAKNTLGAWQFTFSNGWQIIAGRDEVIAKVKLITELLSRKILKLDDAIAKIDMRYANGLAVTWQPVTENFLGVVDVNVTSSSTVGFKQ